MDSDRLEFALLKEIYDVLDILGLKLRSTNMFSCEDIKGSLYWADPRADYECVRVHVQFLGQLRTSDPIDV